MHLSPYKLETELDMCYAQKIKRLKSNKANEPATAISCSYPSPVTLLFVATITSTECSRRVTFPISQSQYFLCDVASTMQLVLAENFMCDIFESKT